MRSVSVSVSVWLLSMVLALPVRASMPGLFDHLTENTLDSFSGSNIYWHGSAFAATGLLINSGVDAKVYETFRGSENRSALPGAVLGSGAVTVVVGSWFLYAAKEHQDPVKMGAVTAIVQSSLITLGYVAALKVTTGRAHPTNSWHLSPREQSEQFQFGFMRNGVTAYGWPSGHVSHTVAVASAMAHYYPERFILKALGVLSAGYMIYSVSAHDYGQMHWFSDGIAGALMGYAIGSTVGENVRQQVTGHKETKAEADAVSWIPLALPGGMGILARAVF